MVSLGDRIPTLLARYHTIVMQGEPYKTPATRSPISKKPHKIPTYWKMFWYPLIKEGQLSHKYAIMSLWSQLICFQKVLMNRCQNIDPSYRKLCSYLHAIKLLQKFAISNEAINMHSRGPVEQHFFVWQPHRDPSSLGSMEQ